jgi:undecaprenyl-diphosphatase
VHAFGRWRHPALVFFVTLAIGVALLAACSILAGVVLVDVIGHLPVIDTANDGFDKWLARHRTPSLTEASLLGSIAAGGVVLTIVAGLTGAVASLLKKWRIAAFTVFGLVTEALAYRATTLVFHEHRPRVHRLENLPLNASYPSGHTAASIAVYGGLVLLLTSRCRHPVVRAALWTLAVAIPCYVGLSRMYRGMHHPLDVMGGALLGVGALCVVVLACRAAGAAAAPAKAGRG